MLLSLLAVISFATASDTPAAPAATTTSFAPTALASTPDALLLTWDDYTAPRNATIDAAGARVVRIEARAGWLSVKGRQGAGQVRVRGTARASEQEHLEEIRLRTSRRGDVVEIIVDIPDRKFSGSGSFHRALDLDIEVPAGVTLEVLDSSGDTEIEDVGAVDVEDSSGDLVLRDVGAVRVRDSSGDVRIERARGDVTLRDSSGDLELRGIAGSVRVEQDSSGEIDVADVTGTVHVQRDSSGSIRVADVGGDFRVDHDGSGRIEYANVRGAVRLPRGGRGS